MMELRLTESVWVRVEIENRAIESKAKERKKQELKRHQNWIQRSKNKLQILPANANRKTDWFKIGIGD